MLLELELLQEGEVGRGAYVFWARKAGSKAREGDNSFEAVVGGAHTAF